MISAIDFKLFLPAAFLVSIGSVVLTSVSPGSYPLHFFYIALAIGVFVAASGVDFTLYKTLAPVLFIFSIFLLLITLVIGTESRGATRWIEIGPLTLQTSEIAKPLVVLFLAWILARETSFKRFFLASIASISAFLLVFLQPDLGSALVILTGFIGALFFGGIPWKVLIISTFFVIVSLPLFWNTLADYQKERIMTFIEPSADPLGAGYNSIQAIIAIGSGGVTGRGLGQGTQSQLLFLPERHTDFIFASIGEELGFLGAGLVVVLFCLLFAKIISLYIHSRDVFARTFVGGIFFMLFGQAAINIGMNLGVLPITGITLPLVSSGGSSLLGVSVTLGMLSSLSKHLRSASI